MAAGQEDMDAVGDGAGSYRSWSGFDIFILNPCLF
jgi:hypothetical protein